MVATAAVARFIFVLLAMATGRRGCRRCCVHFRFTRASAAADAAAATFVGFMDQFSHINFSLFKF